MENMDLSFIKRLDKKYEKNGLWQFLKFNLISFSTSLIQLLLANLFPFVFDGLKAKLPSLLQPLFDPKTLFNGESRYVVDGVVTWGYVLPFFLSNFLANLYGYFMNMKFTFKGRNSSRSMVIYLTVMFSLILFSTWLQGRIVAWLAKTSLALLARTLAVSISGLIQFLVLFPLEKFVLFKED